MVGLAVAAGTAVAAPASGTTPEPAAEARPTVAVLYFGYEGDDPELRQLSKGLASMLITDMSANSGFDVVERERLQEIIAELELSTTDLVDPDKALKVGRLVGAQRMVTGRYWELMGQLRIDSRMFDVETSVQVCTVGVTGTRADFFEIEADIADRLSVAMLSDGSDCKVPRPDAPPLVPARKGRTIETLDVSVAAKYSTALDAIDAGNKDDAQEILSEVVGLEPGFTLAKDELDRLLK